MYYRVPLTSLVPSQYFPCTGKFVSNLQLSFFLTIYSQCLQVLSMYFAGTSIVPCKYFFFWHFTHNFQILYNYLLFSMYFPDTFQVLLWCFPCNFLLLSFNFPPFFKSFSSFFPVTSMLLYKYSL